MILQLHRATGVTQIESDTATDAQLATVGLSREELLDMVPRDLAKEIDQIKQTLTQITGGK